MDLLQLPWGVPKDALLSLGCADRAGALASAAVDAGIRVNYILAIPLGNSADRASVRASAAGNAIIGNFVCHTEILLQMMVN